MTTFEEGYQDFYKGVEFNIASSTIWQDGWLEGQWEAYLENSNQGMFIDAA